MNNMLSTNQTVPVKFHNLPGQTRKARVNKEKATPRKHVSAKRILIASGIFCILALLIAQGLIVREFLVTHSFKWQLPVLVQLRSPLEIKRNLTTIISPLKKGATIIQNTPATLDVGGIADKIYTLESSGGRNDGCTKLGLYNGYGFRQNTSEWKCYPSHEAVRQEVINWLEDHIKQGDLEKALCLYNQGTNVHGCTYAINYASL